MADPELALWQLEYRGLLMGPNTPYNIMTPVNMFAAETKSTDQPIPRGHGNFPSRDYLAGRDLTLEMVVYSGAGKHVESAAAVRQAIFTFSPTADEPDEFNVTGWMRFHVQGGTFRMRCHPARWSAPIGPREARSGSYRLTALFSMHDPFIYGDEQHMAILSGASDPNAPGEGWELPLGDFPWEASGQQAQGAFNVLDNFGSTIAYPIATVYNGHNTALSGFTIEDINRGKQVTVESVIPVGSTFQMNFFDMMAGRPGDLVTMDGQNRYPDWVPPREPLQLWPGTNVIEFVPMAGGNPVVSPDTILTLTWYDTYG